MRLPPHTPQQLLEELARQPNVRRRIARGWILVGSLVVIFISAMAVAHYAYGMQVHDRNTGQLSTPENTLMTFLLIGGAGALFLLLGILLYRWNPD
jgi:uncharacterized BrkB/YihY/UPF0761 family membrane protein